MDAEPPPAPESQEAKEPAEDELSELSSDIDGLDDVAPDDTHEQEKDLCVCVCVLASSSSCHSCLGESAECCRPGDAEGM